MKLLCLFLADSSPVLWCFFGVSLLFVRVFFGIGLGFVCYFFGVSSVFLRCFIGVSLVKKQRNSKGIRIYKITWFLP